MRCCPLCREHDRGGRYGTIVHNKLPRNLEAVAKEFVPMIFAVVFPEFSKQSHGDEILKLM